MVQTTPWKLPTLITRSLVLLRKYPILILPVVIADLLGFTMLHLQHALHQPLWSLVLGEHRSVLSNTNDTFQLNPQNATKAVLLTIPLLWAAYFLNTFFYASAMLSVSNLLDGLQNNRPTQLRHLVTIIAAKSRDLLVFSLLFVGLLVVGAATTSLLFMVVGKIPLLEHQISFELGLVIGLVASIPVIYFGALPALSLISRKDSSLEGVSITLARICGFATVAVQFTIVLLLRHVVPDVFYQQRSIPALLLREAFESLIGAIPFVPLFVAFAVLTSIPPETPSSSALTDNE